jgi:hypothetical protein
MHNPVAFALEDLVILPCQSSKARHPRHWKPIPSSLGIEQEPNLKPRPDCSFITLKLVAVMTLSVISQHLVAKRREPCG